MNEREAKYSIITGYKQLFERGLITKRGPRDNMTDCENHIIMIHIKTKKKTEFHGTFWDEKFIDEIFKFVISHEKTEGITTEDLLEAMNMEV